MIDFKLNKKDDIFFEHKPKLKPLCIQFAVSEYPTLRIQFSSDKESIKKTSSFNINFYTEEPFDSSKSISCVYDNEELAQNIKIALQTELGELPDGSFGSELYSYKHEDITNEDNLTEIANIAETIAYDITGEDITAEAVSENNDDAGFFYGQNVTIYLYTTNGKEICRFTL